MLTEREKIDVKEYFFELYNFRKLAIVANTSPSGQAANEKMRQNAMAKLDAVVKAFSFLTWEHFNFWKLSASEPLATIPHDEIAKRYGYPLEKVDKWVSDMRIRFSKCSDEHVKAILLAFDKKSITRVIRKRVITNAFC